MASLVGAFFSGVFIPSAETTGGKIAAAAGLATCLLGAGLLLLAKYRRLGRMQSALAQVPGRIRELVYLCGVFVIVFAVPGAMLYFGSDVRDLIRQSSSGSHAATVALIGIGVQGICIVGASALPVLLYFVFDREKLNTLRKKFTRQIFRLDPSVRCVADVEAKYSELLDEAYGRESGKRLLPGTRSPILMATAVITLGWTIALLDTNAASSENPATLTSLLRPSATAVTFAFLGAYFFTLQNVLRGYVRGDLRPKTYAQVATRTVSVVVLAFVLERLLGSVGGNPSSPALLTLAFATGVVPETVLVRLQESTRTMGRTRKGQRAVARFARTYEPEPLTQLQGIDIYDRARLLDEGVTNVEGLAHHDLVELLLKTRIPASQLVDWVDQAILYIYCSAGGFDDSGDTEGRGSIHRASVLEQLRRYGIRTASDLEQSYAAARKRGEETEFFAIVTAENGRPPILRTVLDAIRDEDWMHSLRHWHATKAAPRVLQVPEDFNQALPSF